MQMLSGIDLWFAEFFFNHRDSEIRNSIHRRVDPLAGECLGAMLKLSYRTSDPWAPTLNQVSVWERDSMFVSQSMYEREHGLRGYVANVSMIAYG